jgi:hypothetical protein
MRRTLRDPNGIHSAYEVVLVELGVRVGVVPCFHPDGAQDASEPHPNLQRLLDSFDAVEFDFGRAAVGIGPGERSRWAGLSYGIR